MTQVFTESQRIADKLVAWRRHLHAHPELSGQERQTAGFVAERLREFGYAVRERFGGGYGVVAELTATDQSEASEGWIALRADMDALPIQEETGLPFASKNDGVMHACGHDSHTAMLLGAAQILPRFRDRLRRNVRFIFQPHEEVYPGGAPGMIAAGALDGVLAIFGLHIFSELPLGCIGARGGAFMAAVNGIEIQVNGRGGHAAMPEAVADPVVAASNVVLALQTIVSRNVSPADSAVVSITQVRAGTADNVIPEQVSLRGTLRTFDPQTRALAQRRIVEIAENIARAHGCTADAKCMPGYPVLVNDEELAQKLPEVVQMTGVTDLRITELPLLGGGEDFAYYTEKCPGLFAFLGARNEATDCRYPHHHPRFKIDESALPAGTALHVAFALQA